MQKIVQVARRRQEAGPLSVVRGISSLLSQVRQSLELNPKLVFAALPSHTQSTVS